MTDRDATPVVALSVEPDTDVGVLVIRDRRSMPPTGYPPGQDPDPLVGKLVIDSAYITLDRKKAQRLIQLIEAAGPYDPIDFGSLCIDPEGDGTVDRLLDAARQIEAALADIEVAGNAGPAPTRVVLYTLLDGQEWRPAAEFFFSPPAEVQLTVHDHEHGGSIAAKYFDRGVYNERQHRLITTRQEPDMFMRTLLQPQQSTEYRWADESDQATGA